MDIARKITGLALVSGIFISFPLPSFASTQEGNIQENYRANTADSSYMTTYEAIKQEDGSALLTISNGYLDNQNGKIVVSDNQGNALEILPESLTSPTNEVLNFTYSIIDKNQVRVEADRNFLSPISTNSPDIMMLSRSSLGDYFKCVGKNIVGGLVGGAAAGCLGGYLAPAPAVCGTGAGVGAATGAVGTGVGSLFWCW